MRSKAETGISQPRDKARFAAGIFAAAISVSFLASSFFASSAHGNPAGGTVTSGSANIVTSGNLLDINQSTQRAVIDWRSFNIAPTETTKFNQPSSSSVTLNRINDPDPSQILGTLTANGNVILINPNGVFFGPTSKVDVNGLIATTANIKNSDFMAGNMNFAIPGNPNASIVNQGTITARDAGLVGLVAPNVINSGTINTKLGRTDLGSGDTFTMDMYGDGLINVGVSDAVKQQVIQNSGTINAAGGTIQVTAAAGRKVVDSLVTISGKLNAPTAQQRNGTIIISAAGSNAVANNVAADKGVKTGSSTVLVSGVLDASGYNPGQTGGSIEVLGDNVGILSGGRIDAAGNTGGGNIEIGGDFHGKGTTPTALHTVVQNDTAITADAVTAGNGGNVAVWADDSTAFDGSIEAKGGAQSGNGGYVETSGHQTLSLSGTVGASAPNGQAGTWLLDPNNVTITNTATTNTGSSPNFSDTGSPANVNTADIVFALNGGTSVNVTASGSIAVNNNITENTYNGTVGLTLAAATDITLANTVAITASGSSKLNVTLDADTAGAGGAIVMGSGTSSITSNGGNITMGGGANAALDPAVGDATNVIGINLSGATLNAGSGNISLTGTGYAGSNVGIATYSTALSSSTGSINITGVGGGFGMRIANNTSIATTGSSGGNISITSATSPSGLYFCNYTGCASGTNATITTVAGNINLTGSGFLLANGNTLVIGNGSTTGNITLDADTISLASTPIQTTGTVTFAPYTASTPIGFSGGAGTLQVTQAIMDMVNAPTVTIGASGDTGLLTTGAFNWEHTLTALNLIGNSITIGGNITKGVDDGAVANTTNGQLTVQSNTDISLSGNKVISSSSTYGQFATVLDSDTAGAGGAIVLNSGSSISSNGGNIIMGGGATPLTGYAVGDAAHPQGILLNGATLTSGAGNIVMNGTGWSNAATGDLNGIWIIGGSVVQSTTGTITMYGRGGNGNTGGSDNSNNGIEIDDYIDGTGNKISSSQGAIALTGTGGNGTDDYNYGVTVDSGASIESTGVGVSAATITIVGIGGSSNLNSPGFNLSAPSKIATVDGNIVITATTGNNSTYSVYDNAITLYGGSNITSTGHANITLNAIAGPGQNALNLFLDSGAPQSNTIGGSSDTGNITINANTFGFGSGANTIQTTGTVTFAPYTASTTVGVAGGAGTLGVTSAILNNVTAGSITIGSTSDTGAMTLNAYNWNAPLTLLNGSGSININGAEAMGVNSLLADTLSGNITLGGGGSVTSSATGTPITLAASGGNFADSNASAAAVLATGGRWLVYSTNPASDSDGALVNSFRRFSCTYGGSCPAFPATGNGLMYTTTPVLTATPVGLASITYGSAAPSLTGYGYTLSGYLGSDGAADSLSGALNGSTTYTPASNVGTYNINYASGALASAMGYGFSYANNPAAITVTPKALTVTANSFGKTYGNTYSFLGNEFTDTGLVNSDTVSSVNLASAGAAGTATVSGGPYAITGSAASGTGLSNYTISYNNGLLTVNPAALTITANSFGKTYGTTYNFLGNEFTDAGLVNGDTVSSVNLSSPGAAGTATVTGGPYTITGSAATGTGLGNYNISYVNGTLTVNPAALTITADSFGKPYGTTYNFLGNEFTDTGLVNGNTVTGLTLSSPGAAPTASVAGGPYAITGSGAVGSGLSNYIISYVNGTLTVNPAALTITANSFGKTYGTTYTFAGNEFTDSGLVNGNTVTGITLSSPGAASTATVAGGPYAITGSGATGTGLGNYNISYVNGQLTVNPAALTITANSFGKTYGTTYSFLGSEFTDTGLVNGNTVTGITLSSPGAAPTATVAGGPYTITGSAATGTGLSNYTITYDNGQLTVNPAALTITANSFGKTYGTTYNFLGNEFTDAGLVNGDTVSSVNLSSPGAAGTATVTGGPYAITDSGAVGTGLSNYNISYVNGQLTVNPAALTITANSFGKTYGTTYSFLGTEFTDTGLVNGNTVTGITLSSPGAAATATVTGGPYSITGSAATGTGLGNYTITYNNGNLTVNPAALALTITADNVSKTYGNTYSFLGSEFTDTGLLNGDTVTGVNLASAGAVVATAPVGPYAITASGATGTGLSNYTISYVDGFLIVVPLSLPNTVVMTTQNPLTPVCKSPFDSCMTDGAQDAFAEGQNDNLDIRISPELAAMLSY